jgi:pimeloyl-ACP methyl ester carboxylesterase
VRYKAEMAGTRVVVAWVAFAVGVAFPRDALAAGRLEPHFEVRGSEITAAEVRPARGVWQTVSWDDLGRSAIDAGEYDVRFRVEAAGASDAIELPVCAGRKRVNVDGRAVTAPAGPVVVPLGAGEHEIVMVVEASRYERRIACGDRPRLGPAARTIEGLGVLDYESPFGARGGGHAVVFVPPGHDARHASPLLVGTHPWNGSIWTYAAYAELLREARARDIVLLMPSGLGNSLYSADAEHEVVHAIDALSDAVAIDPRRVSIWGASMGGAGATTIAFHHPDRFASAISFFGDSKYDLTTYVRSILPSEQAAHRVNSLDIVENARSLPLWLIHGEDDRTSPIRQSEILAAAMRQRGYGVRFDRVPGSGHAGALVARFLSEVVDFASTARVPDVSRVTYRSVREEDDAAYGVRIVRERPDADAFVDVERRDDAVHVRAAEGVREIILTMGALGTPVERPPAIAVDDANVHARVRWESKH